MKLFFVTPAHERFALSRICFKQRQWAMETLRSIGVEAECVVIADDHNLEIAREFGFYTVERNNEWLGRRFNDGYQLAAREGATHVCPVGSDSWIQPAFMADLPEPGTVLASRNYAVVNRSGERRAQIWIPIDSGVSYVLNMEDLAPSDYRPVRDKIKRGCDTSTFRGLGSQIKICFHEQYELETVAFQSNPQITNYSNLYQKWGRRETFQPFEGLAYIYPNELVDEIMEFYVQQRRENQHPLSEVLDESLVRTQIEEMRLLRASVDDLSAALKNMRGQEAE